MIIVNFKNYVYGEQALDLAKKIKKLAPKVIVAVSSVDIRRIEYYTNLKVFAQHVNFKKGKKSTGFVNLENLKEANAKGTLLNHSEHRISGKEISNIINKSKKINFKIVLCVKNINEVKKYKKLKLYAIALEDPKLISTGKSITKHDLKRLKEFVKILKGTNIIPLCGAGISSKEDYREALNLGCRGVLISSAVVKSKNPGKFLRDFKLK